MLNLKIIISIITCTLLLFNCTGTRKALTPADMLSKDIDAYLEAIVKKDAEKMVSYMTPEHFQMVGKAELIKFTEKMYSSPGVETQITGVKVLKTGKIAEIEGKFYAKVSYSDTLIMRIENVSTESAIDQTKRLYEMLYGAGNVQYDQKTQVFSVYQLNELLAVSENGKSKWKFCGIDARKLPMATRMMPAKALQLAY